MFSSKNSIFLCADCTKKRVSRHLSCHSSSILCKIYILSKRIIFYVLITFRQQYIHKKTISIFPKPEIVQTAQYEPVPLTKTHLYSMLSDAGKLAKEVPNETWFSKTFTSQEYAAVEAEYQRIQSITCKTTKSNNVGLCSILPVYCHAGHSAYICK